MAGQTVGQAVERQDATEKMITWVGTAEADYKSVLPGHLAVEHWLRLAQGLLRKDANLAAAAINSPMSLKTALLECARLGHEPGTDQFALVPFKDAERGLEIVGIEQYQGEIERMYRAGEVVAVVCELVREKDTFNWRPGEVPQHDANWFGSDEERGKMVGVYAYAKFRSGAHSHVVTMGEAEIAKHRAVAKTHKIWDKWPGSMWKKTAIHELEKWVPTSSEYRREQLRAMAEADRIRAAGDTKVEVNPNGTFDPNVETVDGELVDTETGEVQE